MVTPAAPMQPTAPAAVTPARPAWEAPVMGSGVWRVQQAFKMIHEIAARIEEEARQREEQESEQESEQQRAAAQMDAQGGSHTPTTI